jgi:hypothetical protein
MLSIILGEIYQRVTQEPKYGSWEEVLAAGVLSFRTTRNDDILAIAEAIAQDADEAVLCELCGRNVKEHLCVGWIYCDFGPELNCMGWVRLCEPCYLQLASALQAEGLDNPSRSWPEGLWPQVVWGGLLRPINSRGYNNPPPGVSP